MTPEQIDLIASVTHEANRAYCLTLGDTSQVPWPEAPEWQKASARVGVEYAVENPGAGPEDSHASWAATKITDGWEWGPVNDAALKHHPCLVPYDELPTGHRVKDHLFLSVVRTLAQFAGCS